MIMLYGISDGRAGKAWVFLADNWREFEFLPASNSWFYPDPLAEEPGRGWIKIAPWLAKKNSWTEMDPAEPSEYARVSADANLRDRGLIEYQLNVRPPADYYADEKVRAAWDSEQLGLAVYWEIPRPLSNIENDMALYHARISGRGSTGDAP